MPARPPHDPMYGEELGRAQVGEARLALVRHGPGQRIPRHGHDHACLHVVLRGVYVEHGQGGTVVACPGDVVAKDPGVEHHNRFASTGSESLRYAYAGALPAAARAPRSIAEEALALERALRLGRALRAGEPPDAADRGVRVPPQVELLVLLRRGFRERPSLAGLASALGVHRSHLTRQFTRDFGVSPQAWLAWKRAAWTAEELVRGGATLAAIAAAAGFADQSHCTRTFRRAFGTTPGRWYREARR